MRKALFGIALCSAVGSAAQLSAQGPNSGLYERNGMVSSGPSEPTPAGRIHERALREAHERMARMESRRWNGVSVGRPTLYPNSQFTGSTVTAPDFFAGSRGPSAITYTYTFPTIYR